MVHIVAFIAARRKVIPLRVFVNTDFELFRCWKEGFF